VLAYWADEVTVVDSLTVCHHFWCVGAPTDTEYSSIGWRQT